MDTNAMSSQIINAAMKVHSALGCGLLESVYETCLAHELARRGLEVRKQVAMPIRYEGVVLDSGYRLDLLVEQAVVVEIKAVERMLPLYRAQLLTYLKLGGYELGLLLNFNTVHLRHGINRVANSKWLDTPVLTGAISDMQFEGEKFPLRPLCPLRPLR
jgi:GxxExxY protein